METQTPLKREASDPLVDKNTQFTRVDFCDDLVRIVLQDITENPGKYYRQQVIFIGEHSPLEYCAASLRGILANRGIGGVRVGTGDCINGAGNYVNVDDYLRERFAEEKNDKPNGPPKLSYSYFFDGETSGTLSSSSEAWELK